jgi:hypothetical protein
VSCLAYYHSTIEYRQVKSLYMNFFLSRKCLFGKGLCQKRPAAPDVSPYGARVYTKHSFSSRIYSLLPSVISDEK